MPIWPITQFLGSLTATLCVYAVLRLFNFVYRELTSPLRDHPSLASTSFIYGNMEGISAAGIPLLQEKWAEEYGPTLQCKGFFSDDILLLGRPVTDWSGVVHHTINYSAFLSMQSPNLTSRGMVTKRQTLTVPILAINHDKSIRSEYALEFRPERWENVPEVANDVPGVWGNTLTFLGGPRSCIAFRCSPVETKTLLFTLDRAFEFNLAVPGMDIKKGRTMPN